MHGAHTRRAAGPHLEEQQQVLEALAAALGSLDQGHHPGLQLGHAGHILRNPAQLVGLGPCHSPQQGCLLCGLGRPLHDRQQLPAAPCTALW